MKISRTLVKGLRTDASLGAILDGLVSLAGTLGFRIVAEGIENEDELRAVMAKGILLAQGYFLGEPLPPAAFRTGILTAAPGAWDGHLRPR